MDRPERLEQILGGIDKPLTFCQSWRTRQVIYDGFGSRDSFLANQARGWLGIAAARKVLPIFEAFKRSLSPLAREDRGPMDEFPEFFVQMAEGFASGSIPTTDSRISQPDDYHDRMGAVIRFSPCAAGWAAQAAYRALYEATGRWDPFRWMPDTVTYGWDGGRTLKTVSVDEWPNELMVPNTDAAVAAAAAFACVGEAGIYDTHKRHQFWVWWLSQAIVTAWDKVSPQAGHNPDQSRQ